MGNSGANNLAGELDHSLNEKYGPMISGENLRIVLGYPSMPAFRQALSRKTVPVPVFALPNREGKYALTKDVAIWLAAQRNAAAAKMNKENEK